jgi:hypothetical protein
MTTTTTASRARCACPCRRPLPPGRRKWATDDCRSQGATASTFDLDVPQNPVVERHVVGALLLDGSRPEPRLVGALDSLALDDFHEPALRELVEVMKAAGAPLDFPTLTARLGSRFIPERHTVLCGDLTAEAGSSAPRNVMQWADELRKLSDKRREVGEALATIHPLRRRPIVDPDSPEDESPSGPPRRVGLPVYRVGERGALERLKDTPKGSTWEALTNFGARVLTDFADPLNGGKVTEVEVEARLDDEAPVRFTLLHEDLPKVSQWASEHLGSAVQVSPGRINEAHAVNAIRSTSSPTRDVLHRRVGIVDVPGIGYVYVDAGGAHGPAGPVDGVHSRIPGALKLYDLSAVPDVPLADAHAAVERFLEIGAPGHPLHEVTVPLLAARLTAVAMSGPAGFGLQLVASHGVGKSVLAAAVGTFYGPDFKSDELPVGARSTTGLASLSIATSLRDALLIVDDVPLSTSGKNRRDKEGLAATAHSVANGERRNAMTRTGEQRESQRAEALVLYTGEQGLAVDQAGDSRILSLPVARNEFPLRVPGPNVDEHLPGPAAESVTAVQRDGQAGLLASFHRDQLRWLLPFLGLVRAWLPEECIRLRSQVTYGAHARTPSHITKLAAGAELHLAHLVARGVYASDEQAWDDWASRLWPSLIEVARKQALPANSGPGACFLALLSDLLAAKRVHLTSRNGDCPDDPASYGWVRQPLHAPSGLEWRPGGVPVGAVDGDDLYLYMGPALAEANRHGDAIDEPIGAGLVIVTKSLHESALLVTSSDAHLTPQRRIAGERRRVAHLRVSALERLNVWDATSTTDAMETPHVHRAPALHLFSSDGTVRIVDSPDKDSDTSADSQSPDDPNNAVVTAAEWADVERRVEALSSEYRDALVEQGWLDGGEPQLRTDGATRPDLTQLVEWIAAAETAAPTEAKPVQATSPETSPASADTAAPAGSGRRPARKRDTLAKYAYLAVDGAGLVAMDGRRSPGPWSNAADLAVAASELVPDRELIIGVHESGHELLGVPASLPGAVPDGLRLGFTARALEAGATVKEWGDSCWTVTELPGRPRCYLFFPAYGADFAGTPDGETLVGALRSWTDALDVAYLYSGAATVERLIRWKQPASHKLGVPHSEPALVEPEWARGFSVPAHGWARQPTGEEASRPFVQCFDRSGSFLAVWSGLWLPDGPWVESDAPTLPVSDKECGYFLLAVNELRAITAGRPDPFRRNGHSSAEVWLTTPLAQLAGDVAREADITLTVRRAIVSSGQARRLDGVGAIMREARDRLAVDGDLASEAALRALKGSYSRVVTRLESCPGRPVTHELLRPYWHRAIVDRHAANTVRSLWKTNEAPLAWAGIDAAVWAVTGPDETPDGLTLGTSLGKWKRKGPPLAMADVADVLAEANPAKWTKLIEGGDR